MKFIDFITAMFLSTLEDDKKEASFEDLHNLVVKWAKDRMIIPNANSMAQSVKTLEEIGELQNALISSNIEEAKDAYGDILVTLIIGAELSGLDLTECLKNAYLTIKNRKGTLTPEGIFVKEEE